mgnify:CR=1 FL=1
MKFIISNLVDPYLVIITIYLVCLIYAWEYKRRFFKKLSSKSSREDMCRLPTSFLWNIQSRAKQEVDMPQIPNRITRQSSPYWCSAPNIRKLASVVPEKNVTEIILWICLCRVKQEVDKPQIQNCVTRYSSPYWCSVPNIRKLACVVPEKNVTEIILWANLPMSTIFKVA